MIAKGQKLKEGDYTKVSFEQANELWRFEYGYELNIYNVRVIKMADRLTYSTHHNFVGETQYDFPDFKQLCENTFNNKTE